MCDKYRDDGYGRSKARISHCIVMLLPRCAAASLMIVAIATSLLVIALPPTAGRVLWLPSRDSNAPCCDSTSHGNDGDTPGCRRDSACAHSCDQCDSLDDCREAQSGSCVWQAEKGKCSNYEGVNTIRDSSSSWNENTATVHIEKDLQNLISRYEQKIGKLKGVLHDFLDTRQQDNGIRKLAKMGKAAGQLLETLPEASLQGHKEGLINIGREMAEMLKTAHVTNHSYVEGAMMRGWPMFRQPYAKYAVHEVRVARALCL